MDICSICHDSFEPIVDMEDPNITTVCNHTFHKVCLHKWINMLRNKYNSCPVCRGNIDTTGYYLNIIEHSPNRIWNIHVNCPYWITEQRRSI
jgi:hypothetical protein